jgi:hypothetical protein
MDKTPDPEAGKSIMGRTTTGGRNLPSDQDVCRAAGMNEADFDDCVKKRSDARRDKLQPAISSAFGTANRAFELLADLKPLGPADDPVLKDLKKRHAQLMAENIFGAPISMPAVKDAVGDMRTAFALPNLFLVSELNPQCPLTAFTVPIAPRIRLCPAFFDLGTSAQANLLLREAAHFVGVSNAAGDSPCPTKTCSDACGNSKNGEAWVRLVKCVARI